MRSHPVQCIHRHTALYRHPYGDGSLYHVVRRCADCGLRLSQPWEPRPPNADSLPVDPWLTSHPAQLGLGV